MNPTDKAKTINGLMIHLRDDCNIRIGGSKDKLQLTQYGYYHGYKGYRFLKKRQNVIPYRNFSEILRFAIWMQEMSWTSQMKQPER